MKRKELSFHCSILVSILLLPDYQTFAPPIPPSFVVHIPQQAETVKTKY